jgi:hypothetical protein
MGKNDRIDASDIFPQSLCAKVSSSIDDKSDFRCLDVDGGAETFVPRISRATNGAVTSDRGDALRRASAKKSES